MVVLPSASDTAMLVVPEDDDGRRPDAAGATMATCPATPLLHSTALAMEAVPVMLPSSDTPTPSLPENTRQPPTANAGEGWTGTGAE